MSDEDDAYKAAQRLIAKAKAEGAPVLSFGADETRALTRLPPEIADLSALRSLDLDNTQIADLQSLTALTGLTTLSLNSTQITDLQPLTALIGLTVLYLNNTPISDLQPLTALTGLTELWLSNTRIRDLQLLTALTGLTALFLDNTQISDLQFLTALTGLTRLSIGNTRISDLQPLTALTGLTRLYLNRIQISDLGPLSALTGLTTLYLNDSQISDLQPLAALTGLKMLYLDYTQITDLRPLRHLQGLVENPVNDGLTFTNTPATRADPRIAEIAAIEDPVTRARDLFAYLKTWVPPGEVAAPSLPAPVPAPLATEIRDGTLSVAVPTDPPLPPGPVDNRARKGWQELSRFRADFAEALNIANYRPLASAIAAFDRSMGASYDTMNEVGVGLSGQRLAALANDTAFVGTLPDGAGTELGTLAAAITTFANRFPEWLAYLSDPEQAIPVAAMVQESLPVFDAIARALETAPDVETPVSVEYRDELELARITPQSEVAAHALLASTRDLLRTLSENALIGLRRYSENFRNTAVSAAKATGRFVAHQAIEFGKLIPVEIRKGIFWGVVGPTLDIIFLKGGLMLSLASSFPATFGWLATVLRFFGLAP